MAAEAGDEQRRSEHQHDEGLIRPEIKRSSLNSALDLDAAAARRGFTPECHKPVAQACME